MATNSEMSVEDARQFLEDGRHGWGVDKHGVNHFKEHVWFRAEPGGFTECCNYGAECLHHAAIRSNSEAHHEE